MRVININSIKSVYKNTIPVLPIIQLLFTIQSKRANKFIVSVDNIIYINIDIYSNESQGFKVNFIESRIRKRSEFLFKKRSVDSGIF